MGSLTSQFGGPDTEGEVEKRNARVTRPAVKQEADNASRIASLTCFDLLSYREGLSD